jgi:hypothetical protein
MIMTADESVYELRVRGHLDDHWADWLGALTISRSTDGTSALTASVADQAELHGLLGKIRDLGVALISVTPITQSAAPPKE